MILGRQECEFLESAFWNVVIDGRFEVMRERILVKGVFFQKLGRGPIDAFKGVMCFFEQLAFHFYSCSWNETAPRECQRKSLCGETEGKREKEQSPKAISLDEHGERLVRERIRVR